MKALLTHPGTQYSFRLAAELSKRDALSAFYTGLAFTPSGYVDRFTRAMPARWRRRLANRRISGMSPQLLHCRPVGELTALWKLRRGANYHAVMYDRNERFQRSIPAAAIDSASAVIGFDTSSWILAERCAAHGKPLILDQSIAHPDAGLAAGKAVCQQYPDWDEGELTCRDDVRAAETVEHGAARLILAASSFTARTLVEHGVCREKIRINPYGVDAKRFHFNGEPKSRPIRFIFVGLINARKGVPLLLDAWKQLGATNAELWLVGSATPAVRPLVPELPGLRFHGAVPHSEVAALMQQCDVFVFPSYFEGFGLVLLEAMACGLPVITTTATAGPDIVTPGEDGWIIEPGDLPRLIEVMNYCVEHPVIVREMGHKARTTAERFTWDAYGDRWMQILGEVCGSPAT